MISPMQKIVLALPRSKRAAALLFLQEEEVLHLTSVEESADDIEINEQNATETVFHLAQVQFALDFIIKIKRELKLKDAWSVKSMFASKATATLPVLEEVAERIDIPSLIKKVQTINDTLTTLDARITDTQLMIQALEPWKTLALSRSEGARIQKHPIHHLLVITARDEQSIAERLLTVPTAVWQVVHRITRKKSVTVYGELIAHSDDAALVDAFEQLTNATVVTLPMEQEVSIEEKHRALEQELHTLKKERASALIEATKLLSQERDIRFAYDALLHRLERERAVENMRNSAYTTVLTGWIPQAWVARFSDRLKKQFPDAGLEVSDVEEHDKAPVLFKNSALVRPFEAVTDLYGKPAYHELDPTGPLALFFLISFGLALTDAGYGIVIMIITFLADRFMRLKRDMRNMVRLLFMGGAITVILGAVTGGWFSIDLVALPEGAVKNFLLGIKLIDPLKQPILLLGIIFGFGVVQLSYAWVVRGIYHWKKGEKGVAIMDDFSWTVLVATIVLYLASSKGFFIPGFMEFFKWLMYAAFAFMIATQGRTSKNIFMKVGGGVLSLNGLIAFVSDMLSYSRLLALGLATGIIGLVVNLIASMVQDSIPVVGVVLAGAVLLVGHVFNLGINALGAFIHSGRLQFVEFFPKFLEGGGVAFRPFGRIGKYVDNPKDFIH